MKLWPFSKKEAKPGVNGGCELPDGVTLANLGEISPALPPPPSALASANPSTELLSEMPGVSLAAMPDITEPSALTDSQNAPLTANFAEPPTLESMYNEPAGHTSADNPLLPSPMEWTPEPQGLSSIPMHADPGMAMDANSQAPANAESFFDFHGNDDGAPSPPATFESVEPASEWSLPLEVEPVAVSEASSEHQPAQGFELPASPSQENSSWETISKFEMPTSNESPASPDFFGEFIPSETGMGTEEMDNMSPFDLGQALDSETESPPTWEFMPTFGSLDGLNADFEPDTAQLDAGVQCSGSTPMEALSPPMSTTPESPESSMSLSPVEAVWEHSSTLDMLYPPAETTANEALMPPVGHMSAPMQENLSFSLAEPDSHPEPNTEWMPPSAALQQSIDLNFSDEDDRDAFLDRPESYASMNLGSPESGLEPVNGPSQMYSDTDDSVDNDLTSLMSVINDPIDTFDLGAAGAGWQAIPADSLNAPTQQEDDDLPAYQWDAMNEEAIVSSSTEIAFPKSNMEFSASSQEIAKGQPDEQVYYDEFDDLITVGSGMESYDMGHYRDPEDNDAPLVLGYEASVESDAGLMGEPADLVDRSAALSDEESQLDEPGLSNMIDDLALSAPYDAYDDLKPDLPNLLPPSPVPAQPMSGLMKTAVFAEVAAHEVQNQGIQNQKEVQSTEIQDTDVAAFLSEPVSNQTMEAPQQTSKPHLSTQANEFLEESFEMPSESESYGNSTVEIPVFEAIGMRDMPVAKMDEDYLDALDPAMPLFVSASDVQEMASLNEKALPIAYMPETPVLSNHSDVPELPNPSLVTPAASEKPTQQCYAPFSKSKPYTDSIAEALDSFEMDVLLRDSRFLKDSINNLVDQYFARKEMEGEG